MEVAFGAFLVTPPPPRACTHHTHPTSHPPSPYTESFLVGPQRGL